MQLTLSRYVALVADMAFIGATRVSQTLITLVINNLITAQSLSFVRTHVKQSATQVFEHVIIIDLV